MDLYNNGTNFSATRPPFHCLYPPRVSREVGDSAFDLIIGLITVMASIPVVLLNIFIILAIRQRRELKKPSNIILSTMAFTDLLVGAIVMPVYASIDFFTVSHVSFRHTCRLFAVNTFFQPLLFTATLHHLTVIAWERYVAVQKCMEYKVIITNGRLKRIVIGTWLSALFPAVVSVISTVVIMDHLILRTFFTGWIAAETVCLFLVIFFYRKVYLGIRNRRINKISQIDVLMKIKLESKVAKTTGFLTAAVISFFIPLIVFGFFGKIVPVLRTQAAKRSVQMVTQLNSLFNPLIYCYRDHRFRNAILELLGMRKPQVTSSAVGNTQFVRQNETFRSSELLKEEKHSQRLTRSASCSQTDALCYIHRTPSGMMLKKSLSAPTLDTFNGSLRVLDLKQPSFFVETTATIHAERSVQCKARFDNAKGKK